MNQTVFDTLLILHFFGLMMGSGGGLGSTIAMRYAMTLSLEQGAVVRGLGPALSKMSVAGLILMWITGLAMLLWKYGGALGGMPAMFWVKMGAAASLTFAVVMIQITHGKVKKGDLTVIGRFHKLGPMAGISSLLAVIFAVLAFH
jgi:hypothetical protein